MIKIIDKHNCCGCAACVQICPKQCISFDEDEHGFRYPSVDYNSCIECRACEKVCPVINQYAIRKPISVYAAINQDEKIRIKSSSGGIFSLLAKNVIDESGVVFGVRFDENWEAEHAYTETLEGLVAFRGSKYMQSRIGTSYKQVKNFLQNGRKVLFSGTSCQIAGLRKFLHKDYDNLLTIDIVCHGTPSPLVWRCYLEELILRIRNTLYQSLNDMPIIKEISFRDKKMGWKQYGFILRGGSVSTTNQNSSLQENDLFYEAGDENIYMEVFTKNLCLRPSCYTCPAKCGKSGSDITLADYWGIQNYYPTMDDDKGTSLVLINTQKGNIYYQRLKVKSVQTSYSMAFVGNPSLEQSAKETIFVNQFWDCFAKSKFEDLNSILEKFKPSLMIRMRKIISIIIKHIFPRNIITFVKHKRLNKDIK